MARSAASPSFEFRFSDATYTTVGAEAMFATAGPKELRELKAEYTRMRDAAHKRLARLEKAFPETQAYKERAANLPKLRDIPKENLGKAFSDLAKFLRHKGSTLKGQREIRNKTMKTFNEQGIPLNEKNYDRTIDILERARLLKLVYGSDEIFELANATLDLSQDSFEAVLDKLDIILEHAEKYIPVFESSADDGIDIDQLIEELGGVT